MVTAAVVVVVLNLTVCFAQAIIFLERLGLGGTDFVSSAWVIISFMAMHRFKIGVVSASTGLVHLLA